MVRERNRLAGIVESRRGRELGTSLAERVELEMGDVTINRSASKSICKGERKQSNQKVNVEIEVNPRNEKHVDLHIFTKRKFEPLPVSNNQISLKLFAPPTLFSIERMARMRVRQASLHCCSFV